jgi:hypothetical protein
MIPRFSAFNSSERAADSQRSFTNIGAAFGLVELAISENPCASSIGKLTIYRPEPIAL